MLQRSFVILACAAALALGVQSTQGKVAVTTSAFEAGNSTHILVGRAVGFDAKTMTVTVQVEEMLKGPAGEPMPTKIQMDGIAVLRGEYSLLKEQPHAVFFLQRNGDHWAGKAIHIAENGDLNQNFAIRTDARTLGELKAEVARYMSRQYVDEQIAIMKDASREDADRAAAATRLGELRSPAAWDALEALSLKGGAQAVDREALRALFLIDAKRTGPVALRIIASASGPQATAWAASYIGRTTVEDPKAQEILLTAMKRYESDTTYGADVSQRLLIAIGSLERRSPEIDALTLRKLAEFPMGQKHPAILTVGQLKLMEAVPQLVDIMSQGKEGDSRDAAVTLGRMLGALIHPGDGTPLEKSRALETAQRDLPELKSALAGARAISTADQTMIFILEQPQRFVYVGWFAGSEDQIQLKAVQAYPAARK